ncbi:hypothetical protein ACFSQT_03600 [Mesorhizobium calcicola]|uniref:Uncharacterized protein n=1 Tax=Mesorhizobium calcicola TaxID=1300310 RepID=A0ABW4W879_9HYPH
MFKRTIVSGLIVAAGSLAGTVRPSAAHGYHHHREIGIAAGVGGFVLGACSPSSPGPSISTSTAVPGRSAAASPATPADPGLDTYIGYDGYPLSPPLRGDGPFQQHEGFLMARFFVGLNGSSPGWLVPARLPGHAFGERSRWCTVISRQPNLDHKRPADRPEEREGLNEQDPKEDLIDTIFRNGTITAVGILLAFSLGFITHWAANPIPWQLHHLLAAAPMLIGIALQMRALSMLLDISSLQRRIYERANRIFLTGLILTASGVGLAILLDVFEMARTGALPLG